MDNEALVQICKQITYERYSKAEPVFKEGDTSNGKVYILMSGELMVMMKKLDYHSQKNWEAQMEALQNGTDSDYVRSLTESELNTPVMKPRRDSINSI